MAGKKSDPTSKLTIPEDDWAPPKLDEQGRELDPHGLPTNPIQRAIALGEAGKADPAGIVTAEQIEALDPAATQKDHEAVAAYRIQRDWGERADTIAEQVEAETEAQAAAAAQAEADAKAAQAAEQGE